MNRIEIVSGDITALAVDAIVNAANERLLGGVGVDGAIHRAAGPGLLEECRRIREVRSGVRCPTGEARITGGHNLPARCVIHTVGPVWRGGHRGEPEQLASCYRSALRLAVENDVRSIAFPAISCGVYGYPLEGACAIALATTAKFLRENRALERVLLVAFSADVAQAMRTAYRTIVSVCE
jgi:O-acetyl-ADP-ribose deacetylase (regulator of RNase III)